MGPYFNLLGEPYRAIFVDLRKVVTDLANALPADAHCLDVGGGDGAVANRLLQRRPDISLTVIDPGPNLGGFIDPAYMGRCEMRAGLALSDMVQNVEPFDVVMLNDVVHHVPVEARHDFFADLAALCRRSGCTRLLIKDIEPGGLRALMALLSDIYITGECQVVQISAGQMRAQLEAAFGPGTELNFHMSMPDTPNYLLRVDFS